MNKWKALAILFTLLSLGSLSETVRIFSSTAPDIAKNRSELIPENELRIENKRAELKFTLSSGQLKQILF